MDHSAIEVRLAVVGAGGFGREVLAIGTVLREHGEPFESGPHGSHQPVSLGDRRVGTAAAVTPDLAGGETAAGMPARTATVS